MFPGYRKYLKTLEGKRFPRKNFPREKEKGHGEKSQRICKISTCEEWLIYVQRGKTGKKLEEWSGVIPEY